MHAPATRVASRSGVRSAVHRRGAARPPTLRPPAAARPSSEPEECPARSGESWSEPQPASKPRPAGDCQAETARTAGWCPHDFKARSALPRAPPRSWATGDGCVSAAVPGTQSTPIRDKSTASGALGPANCPVRRLSLPACCLVSCWWGRVPLAAGRHSAGSPASRSMRPPPTAESECGAHSCAAARMRRPSRRGRARR